MSLYWSWNSRIALYDELYPFLFCNGIIFSKSYADLSLMILKQICGIQMYLYKNGYIFATFSIFLKKYV